MSAVPSPLDRRAGHLMGGRARRAAMLWLERPFAPRAQTRMLIYYRGTAICWSQVYPFLHYARAFAERYGASIRFRPMADFLAHTPGPAADVILVQPWFTENPDSLSQAFDALTTRHPKAVIGFLDSFAHNDLRLGRAAAPYIDHYLKKSLFKDRANYLRDFVGDTNLTQYYGTLYGIDQGDPVAWQVPPDLLDRLRLSPNFFTAPRFLDAFSEAGPATGPRPIDVQSRLGAKGSPWYSAMRQDAQTRIEAIAGLTLSPPGKLALPDFMAELEGAKLCFSPFGYGELCWRDVEAFQTGAVLIKQDMGHLETLPDLYEAGVTYLPVRWDFEDLEEVVRGALADEEMRRTIAQNAYTRTARYIEEARFVDDMGFLFDPRS